tara:strand:- start:339 stop:596 length:258 start_codon:yes stop_codon:yes gene_type:complete
VDVTTHHSANPTPDNKMDTIIVTTNSGLAVTTNGSIGFASPGGTPSGDTSTNLTLPDGDVVSVKVGYGAAAGQFQLSKYHHRRAN